MWLRLLVPLRNSSCLRGSKSEGYSPSQSTRQIITVSFVDSETKEEKKPSEQPVQRISKPTIYTSTLTRPPPVVPLIVKKVEHNTPNADNKNNTEKKSFRLLQSMSRFNQNNNLQFKKFKITLPMNLQRKQNKNLNSFQRVQQHIEPNFPGFPQLVTLLKSVPKLNILMKAIDGLPDHLPAKIKDNMRPVYPKSQESFETFQSFLECISVKRQRKRKMNRHKYKKKLATLRAKKNQKNV